MIFNYKKTFQKVKSGKCASPFQSLSEKTSSGSGLIPFPQPAPKLPQPSVPPGAEHRARKTWAAGRLARCRAPGSHMRSTTPAPSPPPPVISPGGRTAPGRAAAAAARSRGRACPERPRVRAAGAVRRPLAAAVGRSVGRSVGRRR